MAASRAASANDFARRSGVLQRGQRSTSRSPRRTRAACYDPNAEISCGGNHNWESGARRRRAPTMFQCGIQVSSNFEHRSGDPLARTISVRRTELRANYRWSEG